MTAVPVDTRTLFVIDLRAVPAPRRPAELADLAHALHEEFPAFRMVQWIAGDDRAAVVVCTDAATPAYAVERLTGWGHGRLTLVGA